MPENIFVVFCILYSAPFKAINCTAPPPPPDLKQLATPLNKYKGKPVQTFSTD